MGRPSPRIKKHHANRKTGVETAILDVEYIYIVVFKDRAFGLRTTGLRRGSFHHTYPSVSFTSRSQAQKLATRLNTLYNCQDFSVREVK